MTKLSKAQLAIIDRIGDGEKIRRHFRSTRSIWRGFGGEAVRGVQMLMDAREYVTTKYGRGGYYLAVLTEVGQALYDSRHEAAPVAVELAGLTDFLAALATLATLAGRYGFQHVHTDHLLRMMDETVGIYKSRATLPPMRWPLEKRVKSNEGLLWWAIESARLDWQDGGELWPLPDNRGYLPKSASGRASFKEQQR